MIKRFYGIVLRWALGPVLSPMWDDLSDLHKRLEAERATPHFSKADFIAPSSIKNSKISSSYSKIERFSQLEG